MFKVGGCANMEEVVGVPGKSANRGGIAGISGWFTVAGRWVRGYIAVS